jgi:hypothetical protein
VLGDLSEQSAEEDLDRRPCHLGYRRLAVRDTGFGEPVRGGQRDPRRLRRTVIARGPPSGTFL